MSRLLLPAALVLLGLAGCGGGEPSSAPAAPTPHAPGVVPTSCPPGTRGTTMQLDSNGYVRFADLLGDWLAHRSAYVDIRHRTIAELSPDGSPSQILSWHEITHRHPYGAPVWFVDGAVRCDAPASSVLPASIVTPGVKLDVGHCWIEPVDIDGTTWDVAAEDQFGWGGGQPKGFEGEGYAWPGGDVMLYVDKSGATLTLVHADSRWALKRNLCD